MHSPLTQLKLVKPFSGAQVLFGLFIAMVAVSFLSGQAKSAPPAGVAWDVKGTWNVAGRAAALTTGDLILPGSLLQPNSTPTPHTMIVLQPDGERLFYQCFTIADCARGFRVPALYRDADPLGVEALPRIGAVWKGEEPASAAMADSHPPFGSPRDEVIAVLGEGNLVHIEGLVSKLADGHYRLHLRPLDTSRAPFDLTVDKNKPFLSFPLPSAGLYVGMVRDEMNRPRIHLFVAAIDPAQKASLESFRHMKGLLNEWNDDFSGWPVHELQWAYLKSLVAGTPAAKGIAGLAKGVQASNVDFVASQTPGATAEPTFSPKPGLLGSGANIVLQCDTPGAVVRFAIDPSQPTLNSPVYRAPIVDNGGGMDIKAFASAPGKKDSAVVTGVFRMRNDAKP